MTHQTRLRDQDLVLKQAVTTEKGTQPTQTYSKTVRGIDLLTQSPCQLEAMTTDKRERQMLTKTKSARGICAWTPGTSRLDTVKKPNEFIPLHPRSLTVREHSHFSYCTFLIVPSDNADTSAILSHVPEETTDLNATTNKKKSDWKSTASATAKLLLRGVRDSADAFGPLKAITGGLCFILENCEVRSSPTYTVTALTGIPANGGKRANDRVVGTSSQSTC